MRSVETNLCATNLSRGNCTAAQPRQHLPCAQSHPGACISLSASSLSTSEQDPELRAEFTFPKLFLTDSDPKAQHGPLPRTSSQAEDQRVPHQVSQNHSMMVRWGVAEGGFPRKEPQSQPQEPTPQNDPFLPQEAVRENSSCPILEKSSN